MVSFSRLLGEKGAIEASTVGAEPCAYWHIVCE